MRFENGKAPGAGGLFARRAPLALLVALAALGCGHQEKAHYESALIPPSVRLTRPESRKIVRVVGQPSFIESYERTSIYPKLTGYIERWRVDIGDVVKKGDVLLTLFVPEVVEDLKTKQATVGLDKEEVSLAKEDVEVAAADVQASQARLDETKSLLGKYEAEVRRWTSEVKRLGEEVKKGVVAPQILLESTNQLQSSAASRDAAMSTIRKAEADLLAQQASLARAKVKVKVAQADVAVAESNAKRLEAWVGYLTITAPFNGVIVARNANTFDFVLPGRGDPTADPNAPYLSPAGGSAPIYVVDRTDIVRVFIDVPEKDADHVHIGTKASVLVKAFRDDPILGTVTRTSWALNVKSRTLRAEVDLPNAPGALLPGMYAYAEVTIERPDVKALPTSAFTRGGDDAYCWLYHDGHAQRAQIRTGVSDGTWTEVLKIKRPAKAGDEATWGPITGSERIILGDLSVLTDGGPVEVAPASPAVKVAAGPSAAGPRPAKSAPTR